MKFFQVTFITTLAGVTLGLGIGVDEVACVFNRFRRQLNLPPLAISYKLMSSANEMATVSRNSGKSLSVVPGDENVGARYKRYGYNYSYTSALSAYGYPNPRAYAEAVIRDDNIRHMGYAFNGPYTNVDFGDSNDSNELIRFPFRC